MIHTLLLHAYKHAHTHTHTHTHSHTHTHTHTHYSNNRASKVLLRCVRIRGPYGAMCHRFLRSVGQGCHNHEMNKTHTPLHTPLHHLHTPLQHLHTPLHHLHTPLHHLHTPPHTST